MISQRDILVLSDDWHGLPTSTIHLVRRLAGENRVFWFNTVNRAPRLNWKDAVKVARTVRAWGGQLLRPRRRGSDASAAAPAPHVVSPFMIPWFKAGGRRLNCLSLRHSYRRLAKKHRIRDPILLTTFPTTSDFVRATDAAAKIYYCVDEWLKYPGIDAVAWERMEGELLEGVDGLVATSRALLAKNRFGRPSLYLPHGVDFSHFNQALSAAETVPALERLPRPIVGFFGFLGEWVDVRLVARLAQAAPHASFVLLGAAEGDLAAIKGCANVHWLGAIPYARLPAYARSFDVGLIPFVRNELTEAVNPLKLLEYYSLGIPVLATRLPELEGVGGPIRLAADDAEFVAELRGILEHGPRGRDEAAIAIARQSTWAHRAEQLSSFIGSLAPRPRTALGNPRGEP